MQTLLGMHVWHVLALLRAAMTYHVQRAMRRLDALHAYRQLRAQRLRLTPARPTLARPTPPRRAAAPGHRRRVGRRRLRRRPARARGHGARPGRQVGRGRARGAQLRLQRRVVVLPYTAVFSWCTVYATPSFMRVALRRDEADMVVDMVC